MVRSLPSAWRTCRWSHRPVWYMNPLYHAGMAWYNCSPIVTLQYNSRTSTCAFGDIVLLYIANANNLKKIPQLLVQVLYPSFQFSPPSFQSPLLGDCFGSRKQTIHPKYTLMEALHFDRSSKYGVVWWLLWLFEAASAGCTGLDRQGPIQFYVESSDWHSFRGLEVREWYVCSSVLLWGSADCFPPSLLYSFKFDPSWKSINEAGLCKAPLIR